MYICRAPRVRIIIDNAGCTVCGQKKCLDDKKTCIVTRTTTRRMSKLFNEIHDIIIYETYRCMPLLGDEKDTAPDWEEHIVRYTVVFVKKEHIS